MGKKTKKPGEGKEKTERKTAKADEKKARREGKTLSPEDDIDAILLSIQKEEAKKKEVHVEENVPAPSPRSNCSLTINPLKETELILYGGEFYNGQKTYVYGDLYRYDVDKQEWKLISSPNSPPPRSSHQTVAWKNYLYIFGGEFTSPNQERLHHYKDFWMLDVKTNQWEQLNLEGCPSPRSGHRMVLYKHKIIIFGGFYDTLREVRYYNDLHVFDLDQYKWQEIKPKPGAMWPTARSGFQFFVYQDEIFLFSSEKSSEKADLWSLDPRTWEWNKVKKIGMPPSSRAGFSVCVHKKRALLFGGVVDMEMEGDVFLNELYGFQLDNRRWYPIELRKEKTSKDKEKKNLEAKPVASNNDDEMDSTEEDEMLAMGEQSGGAGSSDGIAERMAAGLTVEGNRSNAESDKSKALQGAKARLDPQVSVSEEVVKPCGRINSCMVVGKDTLYIYGGMMEIKDKEITLDDLYSLNLSKLDEWKCIIPATETEWVEVSEDVENNVENNIENNVENNIENPEHLVMDDDEEVNHAKGMVMEDLELFRGFSSSMFLHAIESFESRGPHFESNSSYLTSLLDTMKMISYGMGDWIDYCFQKVDQEDDDMADDDAETEDDMADDDAETDDNIADYDEEYMADYDEVEYFYGRIKLAKRILKDIEKYGRMMFEMCPTLETLGEFRAVNRMLKDYIRATEQRDDDQKHLERIEDERAGDGRQLRGDWW